MLLLLRKQSEYIKKIMIKSNVGKVKKILLK